MHPRQPAQQSYGALYLQQTENLVEPILFYDAETQTGSNDHNILGGKLTNLRRSAQTLTDLSMQHTRRNTSEIGEDAAFLQFPGPNPPAFGSVYANWSIRS